MIIKKFNLVNEFMKTKTKQQREQLFNSFLTKEEAGIMLDYYINGKSFKEIAIGSGTDQSRISLIHKEILNKLEYFLKNNNNFTTTLQQL